MRDESRSSIVSGVGYRGMEGETEGWGLLVRCVLSALSELLGGDASLLTSLFMVGLVSTNLADRVQEKE